DESELLSAMRPGSKSPLDDRRPSDLGRFGLGLKTASFSQCRRLTVLSRKDGMTNALRWDLDFVAATDEWLVEVLDSDDAEALAERTQLGAHGTAVVWEYLDRVV